MEPFRFRVRSPFLAVEADETNQFCTIETDSIISSKEEPSGPGLMKISVGDRSLLAFARDIVERTEPVLRSPDDFGQNLANG